MAYVEITYGIDGGAVVKVVGVKGKSCKALTKAFEESAGKVVKTEATREMHEQEKRVDIKVRS